MNPETWSYCFNGNYSVSNHGRVRREVRCNSSPAGRILKCSVNGCGYPTLAAGLRNGKRKLVTVHRLVAEAFIGPCPIGMEVNHKNGIKTDNRVENLEYVTRTENIRHAFLGGLKQGLIGCKHWNTSLNDDRVRWIRRIYSHGQLTAKELGECFGLTRHGIEDIVNRRSWRHVA